MPDPKGMNEQVLHRRLVDLLEWTCCHVVHPLGMHTLRNDVIVQT